MMTPDDDVMWPFCRIHNDPATQHWCSWTRDSFVNGDDVESIEQGMNYCVPIVPVRYLYAEVVIDSKLISGVCAKLFLVTESPFNLSVSSDDDMIPLGLWTKGDGRLTIASVINDWVQGVVPEKCTATSHSFAQEMSIQKLTEPTDIKANNWCLAYYNMCLPCYEDIKKNTVPTPDFTANSFGLDPNDVSLGGGKYRAPRSGSSVLIQNQGVVNPTQNVPRFGVEMKTREDRIREQLESRFRSNS